MATPVSRDYIRRLIERHLVEIGGIEAQNICDSATLDGALQTRSIKFVEILVALEDDLDIELDPLELTDLNRFDRIVDYVCASVSTQKNEGSAA